MAWSNLRPPADLSKNPAAWEEQKPPRVKSRETEVYVGNLPLDSSEEEILSLLKDFHPVHMHRVQNGCKCFAFVDLGSTQNVALAIQQLNGKLFHKRKLFVHTKSLSKRTRDSAPEAQGLAVADEAPAGFAEASEDNNAGSSPCSELGRSGPHDSTCCLPAACTQLTSRAPGGPGESEEEPLRVFAVPSEMRASFLAMLLRECFRNLGWLHAVGRVRGDVGLLVTRVIPQTPFFWAMCITQALHQDMQALFGSLARAEEWQPYLQDKDVRRGTRCLAECQLGSYGWAWNRCWVVDRADTWATVMFVDFGQTATIPVQSLRSLERDAFWAIPPLAQPFMLDNDILRSCQLTHHILRGRVTGALDAESHILKFEELK